MSALFAITTLCSVALADPPQIVGDERLFQVIRAAQAANLARFAEKAEAVAELRITLDKLPEPNAIVNVRCLWQGSKAYWEIVHTSSLRGDHPSPDPAQEAQRQDMIRRGEEPAPLVSRMICDGGRCSLYNVLARTSAGRLEVFAAADLHRRVLNPEFVDHRQVKPWSGICEGRPWEVMVGPHPKFPADEIEKWVVRNEGSRVTIERHDLFYRDGKEQRGLLQMVADLNLSGHVVQSSYRSRDQNSDSEYGWQKEGDVVVLRSSREHKQYGSRGGWTTEYKLLKIDLQPTFDARQFDEEALRVRAGARVEDHLTGRTYTYRAKPVTQKDLDDLVPKSGPARKKQTKQSHR